MLPVVDLYAESAFLWAMQHRWKYGQLCTRDGGPVNQVTLPVNTNAPIDYETLRTQLASDERSLHPETAQVA